MNPKRLSLLLITICIAALPNAAFAGSAQSQGSLDCEPVVAQVPMLNAYSIFLDDLLLECFESESASSEEACTSPLAGNAQQFQGNPSANLDDSQDVAPEDQEACVVETPVIRPYPPIHMQLP